MITKERVEQILQEEIQKAKALGIQVEPISPKIKFPKAKSFYGMCHKEQTLVEGKRYYYYIRISEYFLEAEEEEIRQTVMHEVLHAVKNSIGHGPVWKANVAKVNKAYGYQIARIGTFHNFNLREHAPCANESRGHLVVCNKCGCKFHRTRHSRLTLHPDLYKCRCGGSLRLEY